MMRICAPTRRESVLFIGTQFSDLYTAVDTPAEAARLHIGWGQREMGKDWRDGQRLESKEKDEMRGSSTGGGSSKCSRQMCEYENDAKSTTDRPRPKARGSQQQDTTPRRVQRPRRRNKTSRKKGCRRVGTLFRIRSLMLLQTQGIAGSALVCLMTRTTIILLLRRVPGVQ